MIGRLAWRSVRFAPGRSMLVLGGYALGVGVMVALLSIGDAMVAQSGDRDLVGGGDIAVLPAGIDLETVRTGGVSSLYFAVDLAPYYYRHVFTGPRLAGAIEAAAPWLDDELLYLRHADSVVAVSGGGQIPSAAAALGVAPELLAGTWTDLPVDRRWMAPSATERLKEIDGFHLPPASARSDSTWAEWHYFNFLSPDGERWLYLTFLVGGDLASGAWGGQLLATLVKPEGEKVFRRDFASDSVAIAPGDVTVRIGGESAVTLDGGTYVVSASIPGETGGDRLDVTFRVRPDPRRYLPAVDISPGDFPSGYVVPVLRGEATGALCVNSICEDWSGGRAYHDHNWGVWRDVTWDWGQFQLGEWSILYGGVARDSVPGAPASRPGARFLFAFDSLGLAAVLPIRTIEYDTGVNGAPARMTLVAERGPERLRLLAEALHLRATAADPRGTGTTLFYQLRGPARLDATIGGSDVNAEGDGFFETWVRDGP